MANTSQTIIGLEKKFWQSMVDQDTDVALSLLCEPAFMVSAHGAMQFDHAGYRQMAEHGTMLITAFELSDEAVVFPNDATAVLTYRVKQTVADRATSKRHTEEMADSSTWIHAEDGWRCVMHTETPVAPQDQRH